MADAPNVRFDIASFGELLSDPSRVAMLLSLMHGLTRPATELAHVAGVSQATASAHLKKLLGGALVRVEQLGRHRYFQLAGPQVADALEAMALHAPPRKPPRPQDPERRIFTHARTCYQHLAGRLGVAWLSALQRQRLLHAGAGGLELSPLGVARCADAGLVAPEWPAGKPCLDWTERQNHLGGPLGSLLTQAMLEQQWLVRHRAGRAVRLTTRGRRKLTGLGVELPEG
ncbi:MAG TPA: winged helix-turn-helix domain-containing protein [Myxococcales bacterium]|nr:winged helix-turn-helix domain-containing protein [Myxococcales bacterium]